MTVRNNLRRVLHSPTHATRVDLWDVYTSHEAQLKAIPEVQSVHFRIHRECRHIGPWARTTQFRVFAELKVTDGADWEVARQVGDQVQAILKGSLDFDVTAAPVRTL